MYYLLTILIVYIYLIIFLFILLILLFCFVFCKDLVSMNQPPEFYNSIITLLLMLGVAGAASIWYFQNFINDLLLDDQTGIFATEQQWQQFIADLNSAIVNEGTQQGSSSEKQIKSLQDKISQYERMCKGIAYIATFSTYDMIYELHIF